MRANDLIGRRYGMLTVLARDGTTSAGKAKWRCSCDCGASATVIGQNLSNGLTRSCGKHKSDLAPIVNREPELYRVSAIDGPKLGIQSTRYGWCEVHEIATNALLFRNEPVSRIESAGMPSPSATRGVTWLAQQGLIEPQRNLTWRQWLIASRVLVNIRQIGDSDAVVSAWEDAAGRSLRMSTNAAQPMLNPNAYEIPDITPAQKFALAAMLEEMGADDGGARGADHMQRFGLSDEARADMALQEARRSGRAGLEVVQQLQRRATKGSGTP